MKTFFLSSLLALGALTASAQVAGSWSGVLEASKEVKLPLVINIADNGAASLDSPDQGVYGLPLLVNANIGDSLSVSQPQLSLSFAGRLVKGKLSGTFTQGALSLPLTLKPKTSADNAPKRPQTPKPPFPYSTRPVAFLNDADGASLAGTLTLPDAPAPGTPVVLMVTGSGTQDRDETVMNHKPFAVIADALARRGIASLRFDDRGAGESTGPLDSVTTASNTRDAAAGLAWLRNQGSFGKVGVLGHSEGGRIAFALPADFIVAVAAPALRGDSILADQNLSMLLSSGVPMQTAIDYSDALFHVLNGTPVDQAVASWQRTALTEPLIENLERVSLKHDPWMDYFVKDSPAADIAATRVPILALYGDRDCQVTASLNAPRMRALAPQADVRILTGLNHMMQHSQTGLPAEYLKIEETIAPEALDALITFILTL
ncbi:MAG: alpha/beta hydrolase [Bacteroides sp.]|nr:alpha/beta hydrolase [Bacteroides sp.]MBD5377727.1 alpha/beta hydrolase [Bacteroides sp.]